THAALGRLLTDSAVGSVTGDRTLLVGPGHDLGWLADRRGFSISSERLERVQNQIGDAISAFDRAIELGSGESEPRVWRAAAKSAKCYVEAVSGAREGGRQEPARRLAALFPAELAVDLAEAVRLSPTNARVLSMSAIYPLMSCYVAGGARSSKALALHEAWGSAPDGVRARVRQAMSRLDALAQADEPWTAAAAMEMLGSIQLFVVRDTSGAENNLRRASLLDSERGQDALAVLLVDSGRWDELVALCEEQLKRRDNVSGRLLFAKGLEKLGRLGAMAGVVLETHRRYPEDFNANVALALTLIRVSGEPVVLSQAVSLILRAEKAAGKTPTRSQVAELLFARGLVFALEGQVDRARSCFEKVIELDPENREATQALEIIDVGG
ncbi:MAG: tetratricopeptide repeat protein, partial [Verrucomicrobiota bacterium]|nr:tetratricopeptide repeat protein [Verrucomicrobiota bacterium]